MKKQLSLGLTMIMFTLAGCSQSDSKPVSTASTAPGPTAAQASAVPAIDWNQPVTLKLWAWTGGGNDTYEQFLNQYFKRKFPNVTIQVIDSDWKKDMATGDIPDFMAGTAASDITTWQGLAIGYDLNELIKKYKFDLSTFDPAALQTVKNYSDKGELFALPWYSSGAGLFYNKDIFDKFGVKYPTNGMTWPQVLNLAKELTRNDGGVQYRGLDVGTIRYYQEEYGIAAYDTKTQQATYTTNPGWAQILSFVSDVYKIPGNQLPKEYNGYDASVTYFRKDKNVAMCPWTAWYQPFIQEKQNGLNFGVVSMPTWPDAPGQGPAPWGVVWGISNQSKYKDIAFNIIAYMESHDVLLQQARDGQIPAVDLTKNKDIVSQFGADIPDSKGIDLSQTFADKYTSLPKVDGNLENAAQNAFHNALKNVVNTNMDVNTALRTAQDEANKAIQTALSK